MSDRDSDYPLGDDYDDEETFDARGESRRGPLLLTTAFAVFVLFVAVVWSAYQQGVRDRDAPPRILADSTPYRERPADPGGTQTPDLDIEAYNLISGEDGDGSSETTVRDGPEEPVTDGGRPALRLEETTPDEAASGNVSDSETDTSPPPQQTPTQAEETVSTPVPPPPPPPPPAEETVATNLAIPAPVSDGSWVVQIGSFRTEEEAEGAWVNFITGFSDIAAGASPDIQSAEIEGRGTYHRLRIAAFAGRDEASAFCQALQSRGQDCYATRR